jgi:hypothetical protein
MINNNIGFGHIFVIFLLAFTRLCVHLLPKVCVYFGDRDKFPWIIGVGLGLGNIWENNIGWCHVTNGPRNVVAVVELEVVCNIFKVFFKDGCIMWPSIIKCVHLNLCCFSFEFPPAVVGTLIPALMGIATMAPSPPLDARCCWKHCCRPVGWSWGGVV